MSNRYNDNEFIDEAALLKKFKDEESKKYEYEVKSVLEEAYGYKFNGTVGEIKEYDLEATDGLKIEVKSDYSILKSNKLFIEIWDNLGERKEGWFRYCNADILAVVEVDGTEIIPKKILFIDFKALQSHILNSYFKGDWSNTLNCYDEYGDRIIFTLKDRPYLKYMLISLEDIKRFIKFEFVYPWS